MATHTNGATNGSSTREYRGSDALEIYMREMSETPLLTPAEEITLAMRIEKGDMEAREHMIKANLRLVIHIARKYENGGLPLLDLINEGNIGLMKAVDLFEYRKGYKLSTYASIWIKQYIRIALANQGKTIRIPVHKIDEINAIHRAESNLWSILDRQPLDCEIAAELNTKWQHVTFLRKISATPLSLDSLLSDDGSMFHETIPDDRAVLPSKYAEDQSTYVALNKLLSRLSDREQDIIRLYFGLDDKVPKVSKSIGKLYGMSRQRVSEIVGKAIFKLRRVATGKPTPVARKNRKSRSKVKKSTTHSTAASR